MFLATKKPQCRVIPSLITLKLLRNRSTRKTFGLLEKHKDYVMRAKAFHKKEKTIKKLKEKVAFRNPDEFYFKMINTKMVNEVHKKESQTNKYSQEELMLMKTQDIRYIMQKIQSEKKVNFYIQFYIQKQGK